MKGAQFFITFFIFFEGIEIKIRSAFDKSLTLDVADKEGFSVLFGKYFLFV